MTRPLFRGYIPTRDKKPIRKFKDRGDLLTLEEAQAYPEYAGVLAADTVLIDIDEPEAAEKVMEMTEALQLDCRVIKTTRGKHFYFRNGTGSAAITKCATGVMLAIGVKADIKIGPNAYAVQKFAGVERPVEWDIEGGATHD